MNGKIGYKLMGLKHLIDFEDLIIFFIPLANQKSGIIRQVHGKCEL